jgi:hypothetical protein
MTHVSSKGNVLDGVDHDADPHDVPSPATEFPETVGWSKTPTFPAMRNRKLPKHSMHGRGNTNRRRETQPNKHCHAYAE